MSYRDSRIDWHCLIKATIWFISNAAFGLAPLIFLGLINPLLRNRAASPAIHELIRGGIVLFVCCALMGATVIDVLQSQIKFRKFSFFAINISPFVLLGIICLLYLLIILNQVDESIFTSFSHFYTFTIAFTVFYCTLAKYFLFTKGGIEP
jgi:hypothetical protein